MVKTSNYTPLKQKDLKNIIYSIVPIAKRVLAKYSYYGNYYYIFDLTAGDANEKNTSPNNLFEIADSFKIKTHLLCFEKNNKSSLDLVKNMKDKLSPYVDVAFYKKWDILLSNKIKNRLGLIYFDPYGCGSVIDWLTIRQILEKNNQLDILCNISATMLKRLSNCSKTSHIYKNVTLSSFISYFNKKYNYIRENYPASEIGKASAHQFVMIFMTNLYNYQPPNNFFDITSMMGTKIIKYCELTNEEKKDALKANQN